MRGHPGIVQRSFNHETQLPAGIVTPVSNHTDSRASFDVSRLEMLSERFSKFAS